MAIRRLRRMLALVLMLSAALPLSTAWAGHTSGQNHGPSNPSTDSVLFFASDGLRQDLVSSFAGQILMPTMREFLQKGASADNGGLLTQSPPNTGAGWYSLATGAWPGVHGSTNNTFHINGQPFVNRTAVSYTHLTLPTILRV